jgi:ubiquinone/menaquinone biosynthesis C-methylase UbiE
MNEIRQEGRPPQGERRGPTGEHFDIFFSAVTRSPTLQSIWREAYGNDYPEEATPSSFVTRTDLRRIAHTLCVGPGDIFADLACGLGGPSLWVAKATGASLIGIDFSPLAIELATKSARERRLEEQVTFLIGDVVATGLPDASLDGAMSIDAFQLFPDPFAVAGEISRLLRPRGRFVFTTMVWEGSPRIKQYRSVFERADFAIEEDEELPDQTFRAQIMEQILASRSALLAEMGELAERTILTEAQELSQMPPTKHMLLVVRKQE